MYSHYDRHFSTSTSRVLYDVRLVLFYDAKGTLYSVLAGG